MNLVKMPNVFFSFRERKEFADRALVIANGHVWYIHRQLRILKNMAVIETCNYSAIDWGKEKPF